MPLKLVPPRPGRSPYWYIRGTHRRVTVDRSTQAYDKAKAQKKLDELERAIEHREFPPRAEPVAPALPPVPTFLTATLAYLQACGDDGRMEPLVEHFKATPLAAIDQAAIDAAALALHPFNSPATRNREVYTPVSAVLKHAGIERKIRRPKGWRGNKATSWLEPEQAFALFVAADAIDREFGLFLRLLLYTGMRLSEALNVTLGRLDIERQFLYLPQTKNTEPRAVYLPKVLVVALANQPERPKRPAAIKGQRLPNGAGGRSQADAGVGFLERRGDARLFRFHAGGRLRAMLAQAMKAAGLSFPRRQRGFHLFCHTYGTWMRRYGSLDTYGLTRTGRWKDPESADRYNHTAVSEEAKRADLLPVPVRRRKRPEAV